MPFFTFKYALLPPSRFGQPEAGTFVLPISKFWKKPDALETHLQNFIQSTETEIILDIPGGSEYLQGDSLPRFNAEINGIQASFEGNILTISIDSENCDKALGKSNKFVNHFVHYLTVIHGGSIFSELLPSLETGIPIPSSLYLDKEWPDIFKTTLNAMNKLSNNTYCSPEKALKSVQYYKLGTQLESQLQASLEEDVQDVLRAEIFFLFWKALSTLIGEETKRFSVNPLLADAEDLFAERTSYWFYIFNVFHIYLAVWKPNNTLSKELSLIHFVDALRLIRNTPSVGHPNSAQDKVLHGDPVSAEMIAGFKRLLGYIIYPTLLDYSDPLAHYADLEFEHPQEAASEAVAIS